jgi:Tol biopolymer transport system component
VREVQFQAITDQIGMEESPAISPDGKTVAFVARAGGHRHVWIHLLAGGTPLQITHDDTDHEQPRWAPDSSTIIYYTPPATAGEQGALWEVSALGSAPRRIAEALNGGDVSHDGRRIATFQRLGNQIAPVILARDGSGAARLKQLSDDNAYDHIRWSPDDHWLAFHSNGGIFDEGLHVVRAAAAEESHQILHGLSLRGFSWLPDGSGFVYGSAQGSTVLYPPTFNLRITAKDGSNDRRLTFGDISYVEPDVHASGKLVASRVRVQSDIWRFPVTGTPTENARKGVRLTHQTAQVQTPSLSPKGDELVYLSDSGGHGNLWIVKTDGSGVRQLTFERDPEVAIGVPAWSPSGSPIAFIYTTKGRTSEMAVNPDGSGMRRLVQDGVGAYWSNNGKWFYYSVAHAAASDGIEKIPVDGGPPILVRSGDGRVCGISGDTVFFGRRLKDVNGGWDWEIGKAQPENGPFQSLTARIAGERISVSPSHLHFILSPDAKWLAAPLTDGGTSNLWSLPATGGPLRKLVDFGERATIIARRLSWSPDSKFIYAAVADTDADVVLLDGLLH